MRMRTIAQMTALTAISVVAGIFAGSPTLASAEVSQVEVCPDTWCYDGDTYCSYFATTMCELGGSGSCKTNWAC